jgi:DNA adenine methylase
MTRKVLQAKFGEDDWEQWAHHASPLFKWAGGKRRFILGHSNKFPEFSGTFHEPFAGSLAVFFWLASKSVTPLKSCLSDINTRLIRVYQEVRINPNSVWEDLNNLILGYEKSPDKSSYYYRVRDAYNLSRPQGDAGRFIFLMATGWNGVYRTNAKGEFNVPHGSLNKAIRFPTQIDILVASTVLKFADLRACSWETSLNAANPGDFVFLDPPYLLEGNKEPKIYETERSFGLSQHERLARELVDLKSRGIRFMLTNSVSKELIALYLDLGFDIEVVSSRRSINSKIDERGEEGELIVTPGKERNGLSKSEDALNLKMQLLRMEKRGK